MTVTGQGSFTGSVEIPWKIQPRRLANANVTLGDSLTYNGREQTQAVASITVDGMDSPLTPGVDFQVSGNTGTDAGDYMLTVESASSNFTGSADRPWSIAPLDISEANVVTIDYAPLTYNGELQTPTGVTVIADGLNVTVDVAVTPQTDAGFHDMTVTGKGNFTGSKELHWYINSKSIKDATVNLDKELTYNGQEQTQNVSVVTVDGIEGALKYAGYLARQEKQVAEFRKEEARLLPEDIDYNAISGLRLEARQKLSEIRPVSLGQAGRISGVSPADIAVLMIYLNA